jgi:hypothetical protein
MNRRERFINKSPKSKIEKRKRYEIKGISTASKALAQSVADGQSQSAGTIDALREQIEYLKESKDSNEEQSEPEEEDSMVDHSPCSFDELRSKHDLFQTILHDHHDGVFHFYDPPTERNYWWIRIFAVLTLLAFIGKYFMVVTSIVGQPLMVDVMPGVKLGMNIDQLTYTEKIARFATEQACILFLIITIFLYVTRLRCLKHVYQLGAVYDARKFEASVRPDAQAMGESKHPRPLMARVSYKAYNSTRVTEACDWLFDNSFCRENCFFWARLLLQRFPWLSILGDWVLVSFLTTTPALFRLQPRVKNLNVSCELAMQLLNPQVLRRSGDDKLTYAKMEDIARTHNATHLDKSAVLYADYVIVATVAFAYGIFKDMKREHEMLPFPGSPTLC